VAHYHEERNHQGKQNRLLFPLPNRGASGDNGIVRCKERLGGLMKPYEREAAWAFGRGNSPSLEAKMSFLTIRGSTEESQKEAEEFKCRGAMNR
jgi:hypothetical protein